MKDNEKSSMGGSKKLWMRYKTRVEFVDEISCLIIDRSMLLVDLFN